MNPERELFVVCNECGSEVSPYVTECPYCGHRLRKRAPDLKKQRKLEEKADRRSARKRERLRAQYEGGAAPGAWLESAGGRPLGTIALLTTAIVASVIAASGDTAASRWVLEHLLFTGNLAENPWTMVSSPFFQLTPIIGAGFGYGFVCLLAFGIFGVGIERRFGALAVIGVWLVCGAAGVLGEAMIARVPISFGAYGVAVGALLAWTIQVVNREDLRDFDAIGLAAISFVLCALPIATDMASIWTLLGGIVGGAACGALLTALRR